ncbi:MAG TPA: PDZ domain-containing protein, partial [Phycisphaerales bacterium]|nr:PDZ domain-containing protein [Phycisphaerales bacterium]
GLKSGDIISRFQGNAMPLDRLRNAIAAAPAGTKVNLEVLRDGQTKTIQATLGDLSAARGYVFVDGLGVEVELLPENVAEQLDVKAVVRVVTVQETGRAAMSGLREGDIVVGLDGDGFTNTDEFQRSVTKADFSRGLRLDIVRPMRNGTYRRGNIVIQE